jgi:hypothetical protein
MSRIKRVTQIINSGGRGDDGEQYMSERWLKNISFYLYFENKKEGSSLKGELVKL